MPEEITQLKERVQLLENLLFTIVKSDKYYFGKQIVLADGLNIAISTGTGTQIGTDTGQKIGFYNVTPIIQRSGAAQAAVVGTADGTYSANEVTLINDIVTLVNEVRQALVNIGIIKGSA